MIENIFTPSTPKPWASDYFVNRTNEIRLARAAIEEQRSVLCITGQRGIGKTCFAMRLLSLLEDTGYPCLYLHFTSVKRSIAEQLQDYIVAGLIDKYHNLMKVIQRIEKKEKRNSFESFTMQDLISISKTLEENKVKSPCVFIDDLDYMESDGIHELALFIKSFLYQINMRLILVGTGIKNIFMENDRLSLFRYINVLELQPFSMNHIREFYDKYSKYYLEHEILMPNDFIKFAAEVSSGLPYLLQLLGYLYMEKLSTTKDVETIKKEIMSETISRLVNKEEYLDLFRRINNAGKQEIINILVGQGEILRKKELEMRLKSRYRFENNLADLIADNILNEDEGKIHFRDALLRIYLRDLLSREGKSFKDNLKNPQMDLFRNA